MKKDLPIKLKAAFLLAAFTLNTVIGFACAVGLNMGFNSHHHNDEATEVQGSSHHSGKSHHHDEADHHKSKDGKDDCCNDKVIKLEQVDKSIPPTSNALVTPLFLSGYIFTFCDIDNLYVSLYIPSNKYFVRSYHPPIPDIRIAIRSFQI